MARAALGILVVEDHPALGRFIIATLEAAGWSVLGPVSDHAEAIDAARRMPLDLAVMDRVLRGVETLPIAEILAERGISCLLVSGYARSTLPERFQGLPFLEKPFTMEALLAAVRAAVAKPG